MEIIKEEIEAYERIRSSGATNMFAVDTVIELSNEILNKEKCFEIMKQYDKWMKKYNIERR